MTPAQAKTKNRGLSKKEKLQEVENDMFAMGKTCVETFGGKPTDILMIRGANTAYRCMMQAIRDNIRYLTPKTGN